MELIFIIVSIGIIILGIYMFYEAFANHIKREKLDFTKFPKEFGNFNLFFISDIHRRNINQHLIDNIKGKAEIVIIGGDLTEKGVPFKRVLNNLIKLTQIGPVYFIWGNHDYDVDTDRFKELLNKCGVKMLRNESLLLQRNNKQLAIIGIDDLTNEPEPIEELLLGSEKVDFRIMICHNPDIIHNLTEEHDISLVLSGHTHGGQIRILGYGPYEHGGIKNIKGMTTLISNGYGTRLLPLRLSAKSETHLITIGNGDTKNI
ncbi:metallophosphoesterase [Lederbergia lenta]|uniref:metallophosphoesterase n=1 Tax=Lederbergia lenta TaxID=1467 RepID=UPI002040561D|nr:metallophosphoesterase [Lederbergia lenta]MCM3111624.1 metallophosphoesterase [Lederbergia lenta]